MLRLAFDFIITWRETRTRPNAYTIQAAFLREILHSLNHPPSDLKLFTKGLPQISKQ